jgi:uncharacterized protein (TIGR02302 family)
MLDSPDDRIGSVTGTPAPPSAEAPAPPQNLDALLRRARLAILWEAVWPPLATAGAVALLFVALSWFGLWEVLPFWARILGLVAFAAAFVLALLPLARVREPARAALLARIDRASGRAHRPATALAEPLANGEEDPVTRALWQAHRTRALANATGLTSGPVRPAMAARDPRALRFAVILAALVAFFWAGDDRTARLASAFDWRSPSAAATPPRLDAWVTPPAYTGRPPIFLTAATPRDPAQAAVPGDEPTRSVPAGSVLVVRTSGGDAEISAGPGAHALETEDKPAPSGAPPAPAGATIAEHRFALDRSTEITATPASGERRVWRFDVVPDTAPQIAFQTLPRLNERGSLVLGYRIDDDYGVQAANALVELPKTKPVEGAVPPRPLYGPPEIRLALPQARGRSGPATTTYDGVEHPWAGARVLMTLVARDEPGQESRSEQLEAILPSRPFTQPLARALVEQRRILALDARAHERVADAIDALTLFPERFTPQSGVYLGLRSAYWQVLKGRTDDELRAAADYLWEMALAIEEGDLAGLSKDLKSAEQALRDALDRNAPDAEIKKLMDQLRAALDQFMQEMARRQENAPSRQAQIPPNARILTPDDIKKMMDRLENLARGGNKDAAKDMLAELRDMLDNLQKGQTAEQGEADEGAEAQARALDELGRMIREQSELRDKTFQQGQQAEREQQGNGPEQRGENGQKQPGGSGELGQKQGDLKKRLQELMRGLEAQGMEGDQALGEAGKAMGRAEGQLGQGDPGSAVGAQGQALEALRQGAKGMAERMGEGQGEGQGQAQGQGQPRGRRPGGTASGEDTDPLGRPTRARRYDPGANVRVPGEIEAQRARRVLEELRRRVGEPSRPQDELDYLDRLLRED